MAMPPVPMPPPGAPPAGGVPKPPGAGGPGLPHSPVGGPSGPGATPMVSPGTGAGNQARAVQGIGKVIETLFEYAAAFDAGTPGFTGIMRAITALNGVSKQGGQHDQAPLPVPAAAPGGGLGGVGAPPTGLAPGGGGAGPIESMGGM